VPVRDHRAGRARGRCSATCLPARRPVQRGARRRRSPRAFLMPRFATFIPISFVA
jgi:hypothetical protein